MFRSALKIEALKGDVAVIDCTCELQRTHSNPYYLNLPCWDTNPLTMEQMKAGVSFGMEHRAAGRGLLVHCAHGHGRSAMLVAAILVEAGLDRTWREAELRCKKLRPRMKINHRQAAMLDKWEQQK